MEDDIWNRADDFFESAFHLVDSELEAALAASSEAGLPDIQVSACQGMLLNLLARSVEAKRILEIGTLGGYSTIWLSRALGPDGKLVTLELDPSHAEVARSNLQRAGQIAKVTIMLGPAAASLEELRGSTFDLAFIDADKESTDLYWRLVKPMVRSGGIVVVDNVVRGGRTMDMSLDTADLQGIRDFVANIGTDGDVSATAIQTVGKKGHDGLAIVRIN